MIALSHALALTCPTTGCGTRWPQNTLSAGAGPLLADHRCERCRIWFKIGYRVQLSPRTVQLVGIVRSAGQGLTGLRLTLPQLDGFTPGEQDELLSMAEAFGIRETSSRQPWTGRYPPPPRPR